VLYDDRCSGGLSPVRGPEAPRAPALIVARDADVVSVLAGQAYEVDSQCQVDALLLGGLNRPALRVPQLSTYHRHPWVTCPLARLPVAGPDSHWLMVRARAATTDTDGRQLAAEASTGDDPLSYPARINVTVAMWRVSRQKPASRREMNVLVVDEDGDSWGQDVADLEKTPPAPEGTAGRK
jgi:hypothetical protein